MSKMPMQKFWSMALGVLGLASALAAFADDSAIKSFDITTDPVFGNYKNVLLTFALHHRPKAENTFCVLGFQSPDSLQGAWVIWREGKQIILWEGGETLDASRRRINLKSDVVATEAELHGSTYKVTQAWVTDITDTCDRSGVKLKLPRNRARPPQRQSGR
jgi:hypothetical protein